MWAARRATTRRDPSSARRRRRRTASIVDPLVLIVEDHDDSREGYAEYLRYCGVRVVTAVDGREALDLASRLSPDVIVMDLAMPRMDGWTAVRALRARSKTRDTLILALSAHAGHEDETKAWTSGISAFRAKPCMPDELLKEVRKLLETGSGGGGHSAAGSGGSTPGAGRSATRRRSGGPALHRKSPPRRRR